MKSGPHPAYREVTWVPECHYTPYVWPLITLPQRTQALKYTSSMSAPATAATALQSYDTMV